MNEMGTKVSSSGSLLQALTRADHLFSNRLEAALEADGLSIAKFGVLRELRSVGEPLPLGQLAERLACVKSNITQLVDRLEADGLVRRVPDLEDRRSTRAEITEEGRRRYEVGLKAQLSLEQELVQGLSSDEQLQLASMLEKLAHGG
jgi:DNA-binding MarR family transcriptional regulator